MQRPKKKKKSLKIILIFIVVVINSIVVGVANAIAIVAYENNNALFFSLQHCFYFPIFFLAVCEWVEAWVVWVIVIRFFSFYFVSTQGFFFRLIFCYCCCCIPHHHTRYFLRNIFYIYFLLLFVVSNIVSPYNEGPSRPYGTKKKPSD